MRKPQIENKYNLTVKDIKNFKLVDLEKLKTVCWRNKIINAWCFSKNIENGESSVWVGFYDNGKIKINCSCYEDMCNYNFNNFFDYKEIENIYDLKSQETLLEFANWLLDNGVCVR